MSLDDILPVIQVLAGVAQVVIAVYTVRAARAALTQSAAATAAAQAASAKATAVAQASFFRDLAAKEIFGLIDRANDVKRLYQVQFEHLPTVGEKHERRTRWLSARESVTTHLADLCEVAPELAPAAEAWTEVEDEEAHHIGSDKLEATHAEVLEAMRKYQKVHGEYLRALGSALHALRTPPPA